MIYIYGVTTLLLTFIQNSHNISISAIDTYVYVMFGALSVDTTFEVKYSAIVVVTGNYINKRNSYCNNGYYEYDNCFFGKFIYFFI